MAGEVYNNKTLARLEIPNFAPRNVLEYSYEFERPTDKENQPAGIPRGGRLYLKLDALTKSSEHTFELFNWMKQNSESHDGKIIVMEPSSPDKTLKELSFTEAFCVKYKEVWKDVKDGKGESANTEEIYLTWRILKWGDNISYENEWVGGKNTEGEIGMSFLSGMGNEATDLVRDKYVPF
jgi:hypothetical protein